MADKLVSKTSEGNLVRVRLPLAPLTLNHHDPPPPPPPLLESVSNEIGITDSYILRNEYLFAWT